MGLQLGWLGESGTRTEPQRVLCKFCFPLEGSYGLNCFLKTKAHKMPYEDRPDRVTSPLLHDLSSGLSLSSTHSSYLQHSAVTATSHSRLPTTQYIAKNPQGPPCAGLTP